MIRGYVSAWLGAALALASLDAVWLTIAGPALYRPALGPILAPAFRLAPAILFYLIYLVGVVIFAVAPAMGAKRWRVAMIRGALFGFFAYATYDLTNQATLAVWSASITLVDLAWGTILTAAGATAGYFASRLTARD